MTVGFTNEPLGRLTAVSSFAPAKVNLYLHVIGRRTDGYHLIDSLVAFADIGDRVTARPSHSLSLEITGPEAANLDARGEDNLVLRAARALAEHTCTVPGASLRLEKSLPTAAGLGGGSSDAAAALRALSSLWQLPLNRTAIVALGSRIGADIPACLYANAAWVGGVGERIDPVSGLPEAGIVLANPRRPLSTAAVFAARNGPFDSAAARFSPMPKSAVELARALETCHNGLTPAALALVPAIGNVLTALQQLPGALLARMSGSGASCFALFADRTAAKQAGKALAVAEPDWWSESGSLVAASVLSR
jgi:4-diphosphocytidyl-2-C-methyl-D-erythritol kinase